MKYNREPHRCQIEGSSTVCFDHDGELWVKEYNDGIQGEGRTYRVNYCPQCGQMSNPVRVILTGLYKISDSLSNKKFCVDSYKQDPLQRSLPAELREYAYMALTRVLQDLSRERTVLGLDHSRFGVSQMLYSIIEKLMCWGEWNSKIPYLKFDAGWKIKPIAPFGGANARFWVEDEEGNSVSVYLDCYNALGIVDQPYWEVYPHDQDGPARILLNDTEELMQKIREGLL